MTTKSLLNVYTFSTPAGMSQVFASEFLNVGETHVSRTAFTSKDAFVNFPMDEIQASLSTADILIPSQLATVEEIDAWLMDL